MSSQSGAAAGPLNSNLAQSGRERFQQSGFVGRDAQDVRQGFQNMGRQSRSQTLSQIIENLNQMRESRRRWRDQNSVPPVVRVQLRPAFDMPAPLLAQAADARTARLAAIMHSSGVVSPQAVVTGRNVVLRGTVATEHERALVEQLVGLEPGVSQVENLLTVQAPPAAPQ
ncbi:MAG: BON domain-containing protein [Pirellulales bacterium]|nr:BON domain-containing protein [Pirellulales bacterium]